MIPALLEIAARETAAGNRDLLRHVVSGFMDRRRETPADLTVHRDAALAWLLRAHEATGRRGVARSYCVAWHPYFRIRGWLPAYPETTGYIIPTLFDYAAAHGDDSLRQHAIEMSEWEIEVQLPSGAVMGGIIGMPPTPAIFNTGQVIFGWLRAAYETGDQRFLDAARRAGQFLIEHQDDDGSWRRGLSQYAKQGPQTYNTRVAWALAELGEVTGETTFRHAAIRNIDSALTRQLANGWFSGNCLDDDDAPLTHTIAYATRGILETGRLLGNDRYIAAAEKAALATLHAQRDDGSLAGRYDRDWHAHVDWSCLTGNVQLAIIWLRFAVIRRDPQWLTAAQRSIRYVASCQDLESANPGVRGGIAGSFPVYGSYGRFECLNWAAKFFLEAIMDEQACRVALTSVQAPARNGAAPSLNAVDA